jgi:hypothetical protein
VWNGAVRVAGADFDAAAGRFEKDGAVEGWATGQLDAVRDHLHQRWQDWSLYQLGPQHAEDGQAHITARLVRVLPEIATWAAALPAGLVALEPWLTLAKGDRNATS